MGMKIDFGALAAMMVGLSGLVMETCIGGPGAFGDGNGDFMALVILMEMVIGD